jgi:hypothetical protein
MPDTIALIALLIVGRPLCVACIAERIGLSPMDLESYFARIRASLTVFHEDSDRCQGCGMVGKVYSLDRLPL